THLFTSRFFFNHTATTEIYTLSLHDALPISGWVYRNDQADDARPAHVCRGRSHSLRGREYAGRGAAHVDVGADKCHDIRGLVVRSEEHTSELQSRRDLVCRLLLEKKKKT